MPKAKISWLTFKGYRSNSLTVAVVDGKIYVIGGANGLKGHMEMLLTVEAYDPATDMWTGKADMSTGRMSTAVCVVDGRIYVAGGVPEWISADRKEILPCLSTVEVYNPATDTWTQSSDMPRARFVHYASEVGGKIYIMGGADTQVHRKGEGYLIVDMYDPKTDMWTTSGDNPKLGARGAVAMVDGKIYIIGGNAAGPGSAVLSTVDEFTPSMSGRNPTPDKE